MSDSALEQTSTVEYLVDLADKFLDICKEQGATAVVAIHAEDPIQETTERCALRTGALVTASGLSHYLCRRVTEEMDDGE